MHTVTKVLIVFAAILAVLLSALTMAYAVNADRIVADYRNEVNRRASVESSYNNQQAIFNQEKDRLIKQIDEVNRELATRESELRNLEAVRAELLGRVRKAEADRDANLNQVDQLTAANRTQTLLIEKTSEELSSLRANELDYQRKNIELVDRINDLDSQREVLEHSVRALQEQLTEARLALETARSGGTQVGSTGEPFRPLVPVRGRVSEVRRDAAGRTIVQVNVGANDQIRENMKLSVISPDGNTFKGNVIITKTDLNWSVARVDLLAQGAEIRPNDQVLSLNR